MKTFQIVTLFALIGAAMAFAPNQAPKGKCSRRNAVEKTTGKGFRWRNESILGWHHASGIVRFLL